MVRLAFNPSRSAFQVVGVFRDCPLPLPLRDLLRAGRRGRPTNPDRGLGNSGAFPQQGLLNLLRFRRLGELRFQMVAEMLPSFSQGVIAKGAHGAVDQFKTFLDERTALQGGKQGGIALQPRKIGEDGVNLRPSPARLRESLRRLGEGVEIPER